MKDLKRMLLICPALIFKNAYILGTGAFICSVCPLCFFINIAVYYFFSLFFEQITGMCNCVCNIGEELAERLNALIGKFFIFVRLVLVFGAMYFSQEQSRDIPLGIILIVIGVIYAILTYFANKRTTIESQKMILLYPIYL